MLVLRKQPTILIRVGIYKARYIEQNILRHENKNMIYVLIRIC